MVKQRGSTFAFLTFFIVFIYSSAFAGWNTINLPELETVLKQKPEDGNYMLIDSRPELKYLESHLPWAVSMPWQDMKDMLRELPQNKEQKLIFYCATGSSSAMAYYAAEDNGIEGTRFLNAEILFNADGIYEIN